MSNRAYEIKVIKTDPTALFNTNHDEVLMSVLSPYIYETLNTDGVGITELSIDCIQDAIDAMEDYDCTDIRRAETLDILRELEKRAKKNGYIQLSIY